MPELDDHKTDALFREGASRHDFDYEPEAWDQMKILLDEDNAKRRRWLVWCIGVGGALLILFGMLGFQHWKKQVTPSTAISKERPISNDIPSSTNVDLQKTADILITEEPVSQTDAISPDSTNPVLLSSKNDSSFFNKVGLTTPLEAEATDARKTQSDSRNIRNQEAALPDDTFLVKDSVNEEEGDTPLFITPEPPLDTSALLFVKALNPLPQKGILPLIYPMKFPEVEIDSTVQFEPQHKDQPFLSIGVSAGIVFGAVEAGGFGMDQPRYGGKINYHLSNKLSIGTGAYFNQVCYRADGQDYKVEAGFWTDGIQAESVLAECNVLEIPLSLTLHPWGNDKSGLYASTGLTSYLMLEEEFTFDYTSPRDDLIKGWREENTNQHFLGIGHFNLGYQRKSGQKSAFQIESFIHLPLQGIGQGQVKLLTVGASVNYIFGISKKK